MSLLDIGLIASIIGATASIIGAAWAWKQADVASKAATLAQTIKNQLISHRKTSELAELQALFDYAQKAFNKYAIKSHSRLAGFDTSNDAETVLAFINKLKAFREYFNEPSGNAADKTYTDINTELSKFSSATSTNDKKVHGEKIQTTITSFSPSLQWALTRQKESTVS